MDEETPYCERCKTDFPVAKEPASWEMGRMRLLSKAPKRHAQRFKTDWERPDYLCGNCYFDLTDED